MDNFKCNKYEYDELIDLRLNRKCFNEIREEFGSIDKLAALKLAKKRKIGPFRLNQKITPENKKKEYALMARSGFSLDIARNILELKDFNNLEKKLL